MDVNEELKFLFKFKKKIGGSGGREGSGWGGGGVRVDVVEELKFLGKFTKKKFRGGSVWGGSGWGVRVDVNEELKFLRTFKKKIF